VSFAGTQKEKEKEKKRIKSIDESEMLAEIDDRTVTAAELEPTDVSVNALFFVLLKLKSTVIILVDDGDLQHHSGR